MNKRKGANAERELLHLFCDKGWVAARVAGSGRMEETACDLFVGKFKRKYAVEVKSCKIDKKYISKEQIEDFLIFSEIFGLKSVIAVKFNHQGWFFINPKYLKRTKKDWVISLEQAKKKGKTFNEFVR